MATRAFRIKRYLPAVLSLGLVGFWVSLTASYHGAPVQTAINLLARPFPIAGTGGFPFTALNYPVSGSVHGFIPVDELPILLTNLLLWIIAAAILVSLAPPQWVSGKTNRLAMWLAGLVTLAGVGYLILLYE